MFYFIKYFFLLTLCAVSYYFIIIYGLFKQSFSHNGRRDRQPFLANEHNIKT